MTQLYNCGGAAKPDRTTQTIDAWETSVQNALLTVATCYFGANDPSVGPPTPWGIGDLGIVWLQNPGADPYTTIRWEWAKLTAVPAYGWRRLRIPKIVPLVTPVSLIALASIAGDLIYTDVACATACDSSQDAGQVLPKVGRVELEVYLKPTAAVPTGDKCYVALRGKGETTEHVVNGQVNGVPVRQRFWMDLDSAETIQKKYDTNGGAATFDVQVDIVAVMELM